MFAAIAGHESAAQAPELTLMAGALRGADSPPRLWRDAIGCAGLATMPTGILPQDCFDTQPFVDDSLVFACEARLDDREALAAVLGCEPARAATMADSELLAQAYRRWGERTPEYIYGDFAFIAWERTSRRLVAAVDHAGAVPLFYSQNGGRIFVATQLAALMAHPAVRRKIDMRALGLLVAPRVGQGWTMFDGITHLTGGRSIAFQNGTLNCRRWWRPAVAATQRYRDEREYVDHAQSLLADAVSARLRAVGGITSTLSGGLDSGLVTSFAARQLARSGRTITAFTSIPQPGLVVRERPGWDADDGPWAASVACCHSNILHRLVTPDGAIPPDILPAIHAVSRTAVRNTANHVWLWKINEQARQMGARVLLVGDSGNSTVSADGLPRMGGASRSVAYGRALLRTIRLTGKCIGMSWAAAGPSDNLRRAMVRPGALLLSKAFLRSHVAEMRHTVPSLRPRENFARFLLRPAKPARFDTMAHFGIQIRDPTADRRLMECLLTFPLHAFQAGRRRRGLAREMGCGFLPEVVRLRNTRGDQCADAQSWFSAYQSRYRNVFDAVHGSKLAAEILDMRRVANALDELFAGRAALETAPSVHRALDVALFALAFESGAFNCAKAHA